MRSALDVYLAMLHGRGEFASVRSARSVLARLAGDAESAGFTEWSDIDAAFLECWMRGFRDRGLGVGTLALYASRLRRFFRWLAKEGLVLASPVSDDLCAGRVPRPVVRPPPESEVVAAIENVDVSGVNAARNRAMMELMYSCGLRRSEVSGLDLRDVRGDEVLVHGKGRKERLVPLGESAYRALREYLCGERAQVVGRHGEREALFLGMYGDGRLSSMGVYMAVKHSMRSKVGPHMLRRACATHMLRNGAPVRALQKLLGHERLSTTEFYTDVAPEDVRRVLLDRHPGW